MNRVQLLGNIGQNTELTYTPGGTAKCRFSVATNRRWRDKNGEEKTVTAWHYCIAWGKLAELCARNLEKGTTVFVEGEIEYRKWEKDGQHMSSTEISAKIVQWFLKPSVRDLAPGTEPEDIPF